MSSESFDIKFSRVACVLFELRHSPPKIFKFPPGMKNSIFFKIFFRNGFLCRFAPCKSYKLRVREKSVKTGHPKASYAQNLIARAANTQIFNRVHYKLASRVQ